MKKGIFLIRSEYITCRKMRRPILAKSFIDKNAITAIFLILLSYIVASIDSDIYIAAQPVVSNSNSSILIEKGVDLLYNQDNSSEALKYFDKALALHPNSIDAIFFKGASLNNLGNHAQAYPLITEAIRLSKQNLTSSPKNINVLTIAGRAFNRIGNFPEVIKYFDKALTVDPNYKYALANKGLALSRLGNYTGAIKYFDKGFGSRSEICLCNR